MTQVTVKELATVVDTPVERLLQQMREAGLSHDSAEQVVTDSEKQALLAHLKSSHGDKVEEPRKITLQRKTTSTLRVAGSKTISVEVRKKKTFVKRSPEEIEAEKQRELEAQRAAAEAERLKAEEEAKRKADEEAKRQPAAAATDSAAPTPVSEPVVAAPVVEVERKKEEVRRPEKARSDEDERRDRKHTQHRPATKEKAPAPRVAPRSVDEESDSFRRGGRGKSKMKKRNQHGFQAPAGPVVRDVAIGETITVGDLAQQMSVKAAEVIKFMFKMGTPATINQVLDQETAQLIAEELGHKVKLVSDTALEDSLAESLKFEGEAFSRAPVVTVMGHVDHGKTSLLDYIRRAKVASGEAGGITQHIGAYQVWTEHENIERAITFIDTPGHEAFTAMRARGAQVTDLAILVVAADDGIMPQTVEALNHAQAANVPIVVAVNKVDKPDANPSKVRQQLTEYGLVAEEFGGDVMFVDVSARAGTGIQELLDAVLLTADAGLDLTANPNKAARGVAIEAKLDKGRGSVATVLIQSGTLRVGDAIVAGTAYGRVRAMADENGEQVLEAYPSRPVQVQGLNSVPRAGDVFIVTEEDRMARQIAEKREAVERNAQLAKARKRISLEDFTRALEEGKVESLNLIIKGDVSGAVEALEESLLKIEVDDSVQLRIIHRGVGAITESDVNLATIDNAIIVGFNVRPDTKARERASREGVDIRFYSVIYNAIDEIESSLKGMLKPEFEEVQSGVAEIREVFRSSKFGNIAGVIVRSGTITRNAKARVIRDGVVVADGLAIESLRRFKDDVTEVRTDYEAGIGLGKYNDIQIGDEIETTELVEKPRG